MTPSPSPFTRHMTLWEHQAGRGLFCFIGAVSWLHCLTFFYSYPRPQAQLTFLSINNSYMPTVIVANHHINENHHALCAVLAYKGTALPLSRHTSGVPSHRVTRVPSCPYHAHNTGGE